MLWVLKRTIIMVCLLKQESYNKVCCMKFRTHTYPYGIYSKTCVKMVTLKKGHKLVFKTNYQLCRSKVLQNAPLEHSAILLTFIKLPFVIKIFVLFILEWLFYTGFIVACRGMLSLNGSENVFLNP